MSPLPAASPLRLEAPAKLNLSLRVTGRRADGFHELESAMVLLELADQLLLMAGCSGLRVHGAGGEVPHGVPADPSRNLAWRGLVAGMGAEPDLACLNLEKRIPAAAGLGGGSSDAAAAWRLGRAWAGVVGPPTPPPDELAGLAAIGADVPFFAAGHAAAFVTGIGERVAPLPDPDPAHVVLIHPPFSLSTADVFAELRLDEWGRGAHNDLLAPALRLRPELGELLASVRAAVPDAAIGPQLTGSGPTLFVITPDRAEAELVAERLQHAGPHVTLTRTRARAPQIETITEEEAAQGS